jgi:predicted DNA-binding protein
MSSVSGQGNEMPYPMPYTASAMRKTSVYLDEDQAERLARLARQEGRSQAEILREAVATYQPKPSQERNFALAEAGFKRIDNDPRSIADIPEGELLEGFGE